jgi:hypothetical protein
VLCRAKAIIEYWKRKLTVLERLMGMITEGAGRRATLVSNTL